jgi:hypothetical protein
MNPRICICCGEPMSEHGGEFSRNPNLCASCSSMMDGMDDAESMSQSECVSPESVEVTSAAPVPAPSALEPHHMQS